MNTDYDEHIKNFKEALEIFELSQALEAAKHLSTKAVTAAFAAKLKQPGAFQIRGNRAKRNKFYDSLLNTPHK